MKNTIHKHLLILDMKALLNLDKILLKLSSDLGSYGIKVKCGFTDNMYTYYYFELPENKQEYILKEICRP